MVQVTCGAELAVLFVDTLVKGKFPICEENLGRIIIFFYVFYGRIRYIS